MSDTASDGRRHDFFMVDNAIIDHLGAKLGPYAGWVYIAIVRHINQKTNVAFPGLSLLSKETGISRRKVINCIKELEALGLVAVDRKKKDDKNNEVNHYSLSVVDDVVHHMHHPSAQDAPPLVHVMHPKNTKPNNTKDSAPDAEAPDAVPITDHTAMKNALLEALGMKADDVTCWGDYETAAKLLRKAGATLEEVRGAHRWCTRQPWSTSFGPMAIAKHLADYRKEAREEYDNGMTRAESERKSQAIINQHKHPDPKALAAFERIAAGVSP